MNPWKRAILGLLVVAGIALILKLRLPGTVTVSAPPLKRSNPPTEARLNPLDLTSFYDSDTSFDAPGSWETVPRGRQTLGQIPFQIGGLIQLWGEGPAGMGRNYRERVERIPGTGKFQTVYVLHATSFSAADGTPIAEIVFRYTDGSAATNQIRYGVDSRDWWRPLAEHAPLPTNSISKIVWVGDHPSLPDWVKSLRLFAGAIENPKPDAEVRQIDFLSTKSRVTWIVLGATTGPAGLLKPDPKLQKDEEVSAEEITLVLAAVDLANGQPLPDVQFHATLQSGRKPRPYGVFTADEKGQAVVDLPPEPIKVLSIETVSDDHASQEKSWNAGQGDRIPTNYVFRLARKPR